MLVDVLDQPLVHEQDVGPARDVGVDGDGEDELVVLAVEVVEVVPPDVLDVAGIDPSVGVCIVLDEHLRPSVSSEPGVYLGVIWGLSGGASGGYLGARHRG